MIKFSKGQVLIELLLAVVLSSVALIGMAQIATKSLGNIGSSKNRSDANQYAVQAVEWIRNNKNQMGWTAFVALNVTKCANDDLTTALIINGLPDGACGLNSTIAGTIYKRDLVFSAGTVTITVTWLEKGANLSSSQVIIFKQY